MTRDKWLRSAVLLALLAVAGCGNMDTNDPMPSPTAQPTARLDQPVDGASVQQCAVLTGTSQLPRGKTLVLSMRNLDNHDPAQYFSAVDEYDHPDELGTWIGYQWFGSGDSSVGQRYRVELLIVDLDVVREAVASAPKDGWSGAQRPAGSALAAHITVMRVAGPGPAECS